MMQRLQTIVRISLRDYFHERLLSLCAILGLAAVLAPLLVLFGIKSGIINTLTERLVQDPRNLEITPVGSGSYDKAWLDGLARQPETAFVIAQTRSIAATMVLVNSAPAPPATLAVDLVPSTAGDPLLERWGEAPGDRATVVLSASAARKLGVGAGEALVGKVGRSVRGQTEQVEIALTVAGVLPLEAFARDAAFVPLELLQATEDYRDGYAVPAYGWPGEDRPELPRKFPSFRLYARDIYDVVRLRQWLNEQGVEVYTRAEEIEMVQSLDRSFTLIFRLIAVVAVCGYFASMASNVLANVNRKSRHLGVTRLIGFSTRNIIWFPVVQSVATAVLGTAAALLLYLVTELSINRVFARYLAEGEYVCRLSAGHYLSALVLTLAMAVLASCLAGFRVAKIEPSKVIRDV
jgi:putative ABC transport system permease protein